MSRKLAINGREIGVDQPPYVIAEMSANHNGDIQNAKKIIDMAKKCGADAVKLQTYTPDTITLPSTSKEFMVENGIWAGKSLYELYGEAYLPWDWHSELFEYAKKIGITIFSTPFDDTAVKLLEDLKTPAYKIASFECIDLNLIKCVAQTKKPLIISTGMANFQEIGDAVETALQYGSGELILLHCVSSYPAPAEGYNLKTLVDLKRHFPVDVGLSDHTIDNTTAIASVALGAVVIEKHVTLDKEGGGPDDSFSLEESGLLDLCRTTKTAWQALGEINYQKTEAEIGNVKFRRSLYFVRELQKGDIVTPKDIRSVRPGFGLPPKYYDQIIGRRVLRAVEQYSPVTAETVDLELEN